MSKKITSEDPEFDEILAELALNREAVRARREKSEASFREWLFSQLSEIADRLGYVLQDIAETVADMAFAFKKGFASGRQRAKDSSLRAREADR